MIVIGVRYAEKCGALLMDQHTTAYFNLNKKFILFEKPFD